MKKFILLFVFMFSVTSFISAQNSDEDVVTDNIELISSDDVITVNGGFVISNSINDTLGVDFKTTEFISELHSPNYVITTLENIYIPRTLDKGLHLKPPRFKTPKSIYKHKCTDTKTHTLPYEPNFYRRI